MSADTSRADVVDAAAPDDDHKTRSHRHLITGSSWMIVAVVTGAVSGFVFWFLATRRYSDAEVGRATSVFNVVMLVNFLTGLGLPIALARFGVSLRERGLELFRWAVAVTTVGSVAGTVLFVGVVPDDVMSPLSNLREPFGLLILMFLVNGMSCAALSDMWLLTQRRAYITFVRVGAVGVLRIVLLAVDADGGPALWLLLVAAGVPAIAGYVAAALIGLQGRDPVLHPFGRERFNWHGPDGVLRYSLVNHVSLLGVQAPQFLMPLLVSSQVDDATNANFYIAWTITMIGFTVPTIIGQALVAEGGRSTAPEPAAARARFESESPTAERRAEIDRHCAVALGLGIALMAPLAILAKLGAPAILSFYGPSYRSAVGVLPRLLVAGVPWAAVAVFVARARVLGRFRELLVVTLLFPFIVLVAAAAWIEPPALQGVANGWVLGNVITGLVALGLFAWGRSDRTTTSARRASGVRVGE